MEENKKLNEEKLNKVNGGEVGIHSPSNNNYPDSGIGGGRHANGSTTDSIHAPHVKPNSI